MPSTRDLTCLKKNCIAFHCLVLTTFCSWSSHQVCMAWFPGKLVTRTLDFIYIYLFFWSTPKVPRPGMKPEPQQWQSWILTHGATRELLLSLSLDFLHPYAYTFSSFVWSFLLNIYYHLNAKVALEFIHLFEPIFVCISFASFPAIPFPAASPYPTLPLLPQWISFYIFPQPTTVVICF